MSAPLPSADTLLLYDTLADWWHLFSAPEDYLEEVEIFWPLIRDAFPGEGAPRAILELGSGGGNNALHMKQYAPMTLVDLSPRMLEQSEKINPECEHFQGDMRDFRIDRRFDVVFVHDAIAYITIEADLRRTLQTVAAHAAPKSVALLAPDATQESFEPTTTHGGHDGEDGRGIRYLEWTHQPAEFAPDRACTDFSYLIRQADGQVSHAHERHLFGLFSRAQWMSAIEAAGFTARIVEDVYGRELFVCVRS